MTGPTDHQRAELDRLQGQLAARQSILHFAHAAVSLLASFVFGSAAGRVLWRPDTLSPQAAYVLAGLSGAFALYAVLRFVLGRQDRAVEQVRVRSLMALRHELGLDDPSVLLPPHG